MKRQLPDTTINYSSLEFTQSKWNTLQQYLPPILFLCRILDSLLSSKSFEVLDPLKYRTKDGVGYQANGKKGVSLIRSRGAIIQAGEIIVNRCKKKSVFSRLQKYNQKLDSAAYFSGRVSKQYVSLTTHCISNTVYTKQFTFQALLLQSLLNTSSTSTGKSMSDMGFSIQPAANAMMKMKKRIRCSAGWVRCCTLLTTAGCCRII